MLPTPSKLQEKFFDIPLHRYPADKILNPSLSLQLEIIHIKKILSLSPKAKLLEFGCGSGRITIPFLAMGFNVLAVDISQESLNDLKKIYLKNKKNDWGILELSESIPEKVKFDGIIGGDILHHVNLEQYLPRLRLCLKKGHPAVFSEPNAWHPLWYPFVLMNWSVEKGLPKCSIPALLKAISHAGFQKSEFACHGLIPTRFLNLFPSLCRQNALYWGNRIITKYFAFRLIVKAIA